MVSPVSHQARVTNAAPLCHQSKPEVTLLSDARLREGSRGRNRPKEDGRRVSGFLGMVG